MKWKFNLKIRKGVPNISPHSRDGSPNKTTINKIAIEYKNNSRYISHP